MRSLGHAYQEAPGQPLAVNQAAFDVISTDTMSLASEAESIMIMDEILQALPGVETQAFEVFISHTYCELHALRPSYGQ